MSPAPIESSLEAAGNSAKPRMADPIPDRRIVFRYPESTDNDVALRNHALVLPDSDTALACVGNRLVCLAESDEGFSVQWEYQTGGPIPGSPAVGPDGNVRVHSSDGFVHVVTAQGQRHGDPIAMGEPLGWNSPVVDQHNNTWVSGAAGGLFRIEPSGQKPDRPYLRSREKFDCTGMIHNDMLYVGSNNACVYAVALSDARGKNAWNPLAGQGKTGWYINAMPLLGPGPTILVASRDDHLHAFGLSGDPLWSQKMPGQILGAPTIAGNSVYMGLACQPTDQAAYGLMVSIDVSTHQILWQFKMSAPIESTPAVNDQGQLIFGDNSGEVQALDAGGQPIWGSRVGAAVRSRGALTRRQRLLLGLDDGTLVALDTSRDGHSASTIVQPESAAGR